MQRLLIVFLILSVVVFAPISGLKADSIDNSTSLSAAYVPGEILVKFDSSVRAAATSFYQSNWNITQMRAFDRIGVQHMRLPEGLTVAEALQLYGDDPNVVYAEPNYYLYAYSTPNDTHYSKLWGLHNTGQSVNGTSGTADADMDAPEAWDNTTGSSAVIVAVIDSGVDYNHPDLQANIWSNADESSGNSVDDDGNGYVDDVRGWDFADNDNAPMDPDSHGTHVSGTIAAVGNNAVGITGVSWQAKIMPLRFLDAHGSGTTANAVSAINYANANGAHVINCSWGGSSFSQSLKDAIDASTAVVVCAAGNSSTNNDASPEYPASYNSANIITVAATDQNDNLASFSNYGSSSVDVGAPGVNIYSTLPARQTVYSDNFDDNDISDWTTAGTNNTWATTNAQASSGSYSLTDSPGGNYVNDTDSTARAPLLNLSAHSGAKLTFQLQGISQSGDYLYAQTSIDLATWTNRNISVGSTVYTRISGSSSSWVTAIVDLGLHDGQSTVYFRFRFTSDSATVADGWYIDDVSVTSASSTYTGTEYGFEDGTSMAAPHVSGQAALIKAQDSSLTHTEIKAMIENSVETKSALSGKTTTGGRVNANRSLTPSAPSSLTATAISSSQIDLSWTDNSNNETGFKIERKTGSGGTYAQIDTVSASATTYSNTGLSEETTYYYRVRAYNSSGNSAYSNESSSTTPAQPTSSASSGGGGGGGGCFIATAAFGSPNKAQVVILRAFRDRFLIRHPWGQKTVAFYYRHSPPAANWIAGRPKWQKATRMGLIPIVIVCRAVLHWGPVPTAVIMLLLLSAGMFVLVGIRRSKFFAGL